MPLPWVRLDSNIASHDKILAVLEQKDGSKAAFMYVCSLGYCGGHGTDGLIPYSALPFIHGTKRLAEMAVEVGLWTIDRAGWRIPNWDKRQEQAETTERKRAAQSAAAQRTNCIRYHGNDCGCWNGASVRSIA